MTIKQQGGIFGRNPTFNDVTVDNTLTAATQVNTPILINGVASGTLTIGAGAAQNTGANILMYGESHPQVSDFLFRAGTTGLVRIQDSGEVKILNGNLVFDTAGTGILCGVASTDRNAVVRADLSQSVIGSAVYISRSGGDASKSQIEFANSNGVVGSITTSGSSTSYNTSSDYRLKTDIQPVAGASDRVKALKPINFEWISTGTRVDGFLAHELQEIVPEAVHGDKDAMREEEYEVTPAVLDEEGNVITEAVIGTRQVPDYQAIDQSKLVPLLTAALQEALTKIEQLEGRVASLEA